MKNLWLIIGVLFFAIYVYQEKEHGVIRYDCSVSEISPDYPLEVKEMCRKMRSEHENQT